MLPSYYSWNKIDISWSVLFDVMILQSYTGCPVKKNPLNEFLVIKVSIKVSTKGVKFSGHPVHLFIPTV